MGECDNAGFSRSYCLLYTATALPKVNGALKAWGKCLRDNYGVIPKFTHTYRGERSVEGGVGDEVALMFVEYP